MGAARSLVMTPAMTCHVSTLWGCMTSKGLAAGLSRRLFCARGLHGVLTEHVTPSWVVPSGCAAVTSSHVSWTLKPTHSGGCERVTVHVSILL